MKIYLNNLHFILFDEWFNKLPEDQQEKIFDESPNIESYLGINLVSEDFCEEKGFLFEIVNDAKWQSALTKHTFLSNLMLIL